MTKKKSRTERGLDAAAAFLERSGMQIVDVLYPTEHGEIPIVAVDGDVLVRVQVRTSLKPNAFSLPRTATINKNKAQLQTYIKESVPGNFPVAIRFDDIGIQVISEDRALLRHTRGVYS